MATLQTTDIPAGSVGTPSLTHTGDLDSGLYFPAANEVALSAGGTKVIHGTTSTITSGVIPAVAANTFAVRDANSRIQAADPVGVTDVVTLQYLTAYSSGVKDPKDAARVATTTNGTLATAYENGDTIDGVVLVTGDRILIKDQTTGSENGIYTVNASGAPTRATDADISAEVTSGMFLWVNEGTVNADSGWLLTTNDPITLDTTALTFTQVSGLGQITAGNALTKTGNTLNVAVDNVGIEINTDALRLKDNGVTDAKLRQGGPLTVIGRTANTTGNVADIAATAASGAVLRESGSTIGFGTVATAGIANSAITNAKLANMVQDTFKGRADAAGTGAPTDLTADQAMAILNTSTVDLNDARLTANVPLLNISNSFSKAQIVVPVALTDAANIATDASLSNVFTVTLGGNRTLDNPTNPTHGQTILIHVKQDGTGTRTLAYGTAWDFKGTNTVSTTAGATDIISATYNSTAAKWFSTLARQQASTVNADTLDSLDSTDFLRVNGANVATAGITFSDSTMFFLNLNGLTTTGLKWDTTANQFQFQDAGTTRAYIDLDNGELSATSIIETSDERLKSDITNIDGAKALKQIKKMQGVYFTRNDTKEKEVGLIAQRVQALEPLLVQEDKNTGYLSVNYTRITALLIEAIKEQQDTIDTLRQQVDSMRYGENSKAP